MTGELDLTSLKDLLGNLSTKNTVDDGLLINTAPPPAEPTDNWWNSQLDELLQENGIEIPLHDFPKHDSIGSKEESSDSENGFYIDSYRHMRCPTSRIQ